MSEIKKITDKMISESEFEAAIFFHRRETLTMSPLFKMDESGDIRKQIVKLYEYADAVKYMADKLTNDLLKKSGKMN